MVKFFLPKLLTTATGLKIASSRKFLSFVTFLNFCSKSSVPFCCNSASNKNRSKSSHEFERLRPFLVFCRLSEVISHFSFVKKFARLHLSSREFDRLRIIPLRRADDVEHGTLLKLSTLNSLKTILFRFGPWDSSHLKPPTQTNHNIPPNVLHYTTSRVNRKRGVDS